MFTVDERARLRRSLVEAARQDGDVASAALLGSAALDREDAWSDIDLGLSLAGGADHDAVRERWTERMYGEHEAVHHFDVSSRGALYRVFLLASTLQVDLSFWPAEAFRPAGPRFRLLFGTAGEPAAAAPTDPEALVGMAWLYLLHARSSIGRGRQLQARFMLDEARNRVLALACVRRDLSPREGRGFDELPDALRRTAQRLLPGSLDADEANRVLAALRDLLLSETRGLDAQLAGRLSAPLASIGAG